MWVNEWFAAGVNKACCRARLKPDGTRAETRFLLPPERTSPLKSAGASLQLTAGSRGVRISGSNAGYTTFLGNMWVLATHSIRQFPLHFPSCASPCAVVFQLDSTYECICSILYNNCNCSKSKSEIEEAVFFTFMWPCILTNFFIIKPTRCTYFKNLFWHETLHVLDSSSVHHQKFIHHTLSNVPSWSFGKAVYKPVWHIQFLSVWWINFWWWTDELSETCRVSCQNKFVKLVHLVGFIIKKFEEAV
jgi:hypothetical protein